MATEAPPHRPDEDLATLETSLTHGQLPGNALAGIGAASLVIAGIVAFGLMDSNVGLFVLIAYVLFLITSYLLSRQVEGGRRATDRAVTVIVSGAFAVAMVPLISLFWTVLSRGIVRFDAELFTTTMRNVVGEGGGLLHALTGTLIITSLAALISIPIGILTAIYLVEYGRGKLARSITLMVDVMTGIPSIVAGLFAVGLFVALTGPGHRSGMAGAVALSVLMIPIAVRATEEMLRLVPNELREASYGLGVPKWRTITKVVLPTAIGGILTGITLAIARVIGETAPLLVAAGFTANMNLNPFSERMMSLPMMAYNSYQQPGLNIDASHARSWAASLVLMLIVMVLFAVARVLAKVLKPKGLR